MHGCLQPIMLLSRALWSLQIVTTAAGVSAELQIGQKSVRLATCYNAGHCMHLSSISCKGARLQASEESGGCEPHRPLGMQLDGVG